MGRGGQGSWGLASGAVLLLAMALAAVPAEAATKRKGSTNKDTTVFKWVDEEGVTHYGDQVPPEYAERDREIINRYGVAVRTEQFNKSEEQLAAERQAAAERAAAAAAARRDAVLLSTYLTVDEIEALRDRRIDLIAGQIRITESYLQSLRDKLAELQEEASAYKPYSTDPEAPEIDQTLADEIGAVLDSIALYERTLTDTQNRQNRLTAQFNADIARFRELTAL